MTLTHARCRAQKPDARRRKVSDGNGLQFWVLPNGKKCWTLIYQYRLRQRSLALGPYPQVALSEARCKRELARSLLRAGKDPAVEWTLAPLGDNDERPSRATFSDIATAFLAVRAKANGLAAATLEKKTWLVGLANETLGTKQVSDIHPMDVLQVLQDLEARGLHSSQSAV